VARIVKKHQLLWDPCVDGISHRLPRTFVKRGSGDPEREFERLRTLAQGMGERDGLWIYPEGTRFTPDKQRRVLARLRDRHPEAAQRAARLTCTLPPRPGGTLALLDHCPGMDVVFCAHTGLEGANRLENLIRGSLLDQTVKVQFWRVPAAEIPAGDEERMAWMHEWWERIDRWVVANQSSSTVANTDSAGEPATAA
ncbi:MAG: 1-acyl-sn-glycerol-3-phosphate acyltransferase, partial [Myxococcota bacterium]